MGTLVVALLTEGAMFPFKYLTPTVRKPFVLSNGHAISCFLRRSSDAVITQQLSGSLSFFPTSA